MIDAGIGRLLIASLHQGILDIAPTRLEFYEHWLAPPGLGDSKFGLAPLQAVLSFLRLEGQATYERVMSRAGQYSADWAHAELPSLACAVMARAPCLLRTRWALRISRHLVTQTVRSSSAQSRLRKRAATFRIRGSIFCAVRETAAWPLCAFYAAAVERYFERYGVEACVRIIECRARSGPDCDLSVTLGPARASAEAA